MTNFFGPVLGSQLQVASPGSAQVHETGLDLPALHAFVATLERVGDELQLAPDARGELEADLRTLHSQLASPKPKAAIRRETLCSVRTILEGATGGALGNAATILLPKVLALLQ